MWFMSQFFFWHSTHHRGNRVLNLTVLCLRLVLSLLKYRKGLSWVPRCSRCITVSLRNIYASSDGTRLYYFFLSNSLNNAIDCIKEDLTNTAYIYDDHSKSVTLLFGSKHYSQFTSILLSVKEISIQIS